MSTMRFADEVVPRPTSTGSRPRRQADAEGAEMATQLIDALASDWKPKRYHDTYTEELRKRITARGTGKKVAEEERGDGAARPRCST